jgi:hypothetical protein
MSTILHHRIISAERMIMIRWRERVGNIVKNGRVAVGQVVEIQTHHDIIIIIKDQRRRKNGGHRHRGGMTDRGGIEIVIKE